MSVFISQSVHNTLARLSLPRSKSTGERTVVFPVDCQNAARAHVHRGESLGEWLGRIVDMVGNVEDLLLEENILLIGEARILKNEFQYVNLQSLITLNGSIEDYYLGKAGIDTHYYRLDFDNRIAVGGIFKEPLPHLHTFPRDEPRFPLLFSSYNTCITDFLEFLYMNYQYKTWREWARSEWERECFDDDASSLFITIDEAFKTGKVELLRNTYNAKILEIKKSLHKIKCDVSVNLPGIPVYFQSLNYSCPAII